MKEIKKGEIVGRISYGKDIIFIVKRIIKTHKGTIAILKGIVERIEVDSDIKDLEVIDNEKLKFDLKKFDNRLERRLKTVSEEQEDKYYKIGLLTTNDRSQKKMVTGKILHLDGDKKYSEKSYRYYRKLGLEAVVKNIPEYRQPKIVYKLLEAYNPDILIITGHDGMIKSQRDYYNIYNYRNSKYFIETVKEARRYDKEKNKNLVIFARCLSKLF